MKAWERNSKNNNVAPDGGEALSLYGEQASDYNQKKKMGVIPPYNISPHYSFMSYKTICLLSSRLHLPK